jgi:hypothetical protein
MGLHLAVYCHVQFLLILPGSFEREGLVLLVAFFFLGDFLGDGDLRLCFWGAEAETATMIEEMEMEM